MHPLWSDGPDTAKRLPEQSDRPKAPREHNFSIHSSENLRRLFLIRIPSLDGGMYLNEQSIFPTSPHGDNQRRTGYRGENDCHRLNTLSMLIRLLHCECEARWPKAVNLAIGGVPTLNMFVENAIAKGVEILSDQYGKTKRAGEKEM